MARRPRCPQPQWKPCCIIAVCTMDSSSVGWLQREEKRSNARRILDGAALKGFLSGRLHGMPLQTLVDAVRASKKRVSPDGCFEFLTNIGVTNREKLLPPFTSGPLCIVCHHETRGRVAHDRPAGAGKFSDAIYEFFDPGFEIKSIQVLTLSTLCCLHRPALHFLG